MDSLREIAETHKQSHPEYLLFFCFVGGHHYEDVWVRQNGVPVSFFCSLRQSGSGVQEITSFCPISLNEIHNLPLVQDSAVVR